MTIEWRWPDVRYSINYAVRSEAKKATHILAIELRRLDFLGIQRMNVTERAGESAQFSFLFGD
jgi:hypothetical protein